MSRRAELKLGRRLRVQAVIDPDEQRARKALENKSSASVADTYTETLVLPNLEAYASLVKEGKMPEPK